MSQFLLQTGVVANLEYIKDNWTNITIAGTRFSPPETPPGGVSEELSAQSITWGDISYDTNDNFGSMDIVGFVDFQIEQQNMVFAVDRINLYEGGLLRARWTFDPVSFQVPGTFRVQSLPIRLNSGQ